MARQRATHSMEAILEEAIAILDEGGERALTLRALAARLGGGVGSLYWYVSGKDELMQRATDQLVGVAIERSEEILKRRRKVREDPVASLRVVAVTLFEVMGAHPWMGAHLIQDVELQTQSMRFWESVGREVTRMGLSGCDAFYGASAVINYVVGVAAEAAYQGPPSESMTREEYFEQEVERWRELPIEEFPFIHSMVDQFIRHDDAAQFEFGLDRLLDGLQLRAQMKAQQKAPRKGRS